MNEIFVILTWFHHIDELITNNHGVREDLLTLVGLLEWRLRW